MTDPEHQLCDCVQEWERGEDIPEDELDKRRCPNDAVGKFRYESEAGAIESWLCDEHRQEFESAIMSEVAIDE